VPWDGTQHNGFLKTLVLGEGGVMSFEKALQSPIVKLKELCLCDCKISDEGLKALANWVEHNNSLRVPILHRSTFGDMV